MPYDKASKLKLIRATEDAKWLLDSSSRGFPIEYADLRDTSDSLALHLFDAIKTLCPHEDAETPKEVKRAYTLSTMLLLEIDRKPILGPYPGHEIGKAAYSRRPFAHRSLTGMIMSSTMDAAAHTLDQWADAADIGFVDTRRSEQNNAAAVALASDFVLTDAGYYICELGMENNVEQSVAHHRLPYDVYRNIEGKTLAVFENIGVPSTRQDIIHARAHWTGLTNVREWASGKPADGEVPPPLKEESLMFADDTELEKYLENVWLPGVAQERLALWNAYKGHGLPGIEVITGVRAEIGLKKSFLN
ncbi:MAG: hypothetical protein HYS81_03290 [Candidatus Aenigmatarchaeota archaeon]|nr:MAG: hypothetical protein HYS81_03290 [Candidatus Aenigmarchaeota archaeon]